MTRTIFFLTLAIVAAGFSATAQAQTLTGITLFRLNTSNDTVYEGWNTRGNDSISNLYLLSGGNFVNSGNGASAGVTLNLNAPGIYTFAFVGENVNTNTATALGINFFFAGSNTTPGISARGTAVTNNSGDFITNAGVTNTPDYSGIIGANTLTFLNNGNIVTLSAFTYNTSSGANQVTSFDNVPDGTPDTVGSFTLTVTSTTAPEPSGIALLAPVFLGGILCKRVRRA